MKTVYSKYIKRVLDFIISLLALTVLSPLLLVLTLVGAVKMADRIVREMMGL